MSKLLKQQQRKEYHQAFDKNKIHHGHGSRYWIKKKEQAALGSSSEK